MLLGIAILLLLNVAALGVGRLPASWVCKESLAEPEGVLISLALGFGVIGYGVLLAGLVGVLYGWLFWGVAVAAFVLSVPAVRSVIRQAGSWGASGGAARHRGIGWFLVVLVAAHAALFFLVSLAPPTETDTLIYHLSLPKHYLGAHRMDFLWESYFGTMAYLMEALYTAGLALGSDRVAALLQLEFSLLTAILVWLCCRRWFPKADGAVPVAVFYCMPILAVSATSGMVEMGVTFYSLLALSLLMDSVRGGRLRMLVLAGVIGGLAAATKMVGFFVVAALPILVVVDGAMGRRSPGGVVGRALLVVGIAILVASPWFIRNLIWCGNPFFPECYGLFGASHWSDYSHSTVSHIHRGYAGRYADRGFAGLFTAFWSLTNFEGTGRSISSSIGPLHIGLLPLWVYALKERLPALLLGVFALVCYLMWYYTAPYVDVHHLMPLLPVSALLGGAGLCYSPLWGGFARKLSIGVLVLAMVHSLCVGAVFAGQFLPYLTGRESREELLGRAAAFHDDIRWMNTHLDRTCKVAMTVAHSYYLDIPHLPLAPYRQGQIDFSALSDSGALLDRLAARGVTHLYVATARIDDDVVQRHPPLRPYVELMRDLLASSRVRCVYRNPTGGAGGRKPKWAPGGTGGSTTAVYELLTEHRERSR